MRGISWGQVGTARRIKLKRGRFALVVLAAGLISPASALAGPGGSNLPLIGHSSGVLSFDSATSAFTSSGSGVGSLLGAFKITNSGSIMGTGFIPPSFVPFTTTGTQTVVAANGDQLTGALTGTGVIDDDLGTSSGGTSSGTNVITITGGTGRFANATGSYTVTYATQTPSVVGTVLTSTVTSTIQGNINLGVGAAVDRSTRKAHKRQRRRSVHRVA